MREYFNPVLDVLNYQLFSVGQATITPLGILVFIVLSIVLVWGTGWLRHVLVSKLLERTPLKFGARQAIGTIVRYLMLLVGFIIILQTVGVDLTAFNVLAGAVGIGIGLGLQNIANNFISGLIILLERPIQTGDRIEVGNVTGRVVAIGARSTRILTNDNIAIIVPNSKFVTENVVNWSYERETVRFKIPVMVTHETDINLLKDLMLQAARENKDVVEDPPPVVRFMKMDEEGLYFELRAWSRVRLHKPTALRSDLTFAIVNMLRENNIRVSRNQADPSDPNAKSEPGPGRSDRRKEAANGTEPDLDLSRSMSQ
jgi:small-conductance mechanosensitive channel